MLMRQFEANGYAVAHDPERPDGEIVVINTCGFIGDAKEESINTILQFGEARKKNKINRLYVMGCLSQRYMDELQELIPEVDKYYGKFNWADLLADLKQPYHAELYNRRTLTTPSHYAYVKIAEGCNRHCAYCSIPLITGQYQSRPIEEIEDEVRELVKGGVKELQLIAQDLTYYGKDLYKKYNLAELVERLSDIPGVEWIRLHYAYPTHFPLDLLKVMRERENVCNYLDIALQHSSDHMLGMMRRNITRKETTELLQKIREEVPGIHLRTTMMVGHPGETEADVEEMLDFVRKMRFERLGGFTYSDEEGTYSNRHYGDPIEQEEKDRRLEKLMVIQEEIATELNQQKIGSVQRVIIDREEPDFYIGRTQYDSPEVDPEVLIAKENELTIGEFYEVRITDSHLHDLIGEILTHH